MKIGPKLSTPLLPPTRGPAEFPPDGVTLSGQSASPEIDRAAALAACASPPQLIRDAVFQANFEHTQGWLGADGAYSIPMPDGRVLWLFSDTITGRIGEDGSLQPG